MVRRVVQQRIAAIAFALITLFIFSALTTQVNAYKVDKATLSWQLPDGTMVPVKTLAPTATLSGVVLILNISDDFKDCFGSGKYSGTCMIRLSSTSLSGLGVLNVGSSCTEIGTGKYSCTTDSFTISRPTASSSVKYTIYYGRGNAAQSTAQQEFTLPLVLDTTAPKVSSIATGFCTGDGVTCYAAANLPSPVTVTFEDTVTSFDYRLVFLGAQGASSLATIDACSGKVCKGTIQLACADNQEVYLQLTPIYGVDTQEDALNPAVLGSPQKVICKTGAPQMLEWNAPVFDGPAAAAGKGVSGGGFKIVAKVRASVGTLSSVINTSAISENDLTTATCAVASTETDPTVFTCTWQVTRLKPGSTTLDFKVKDAIGGYQSASHPSRSVKIDVLNITVATGANRGFYTATAGDVTPKQINRMAIGLAAKSFKPYPTYVTYTLTPRRGNPKLLHQELKECWYKLPSEENYSNSAKYNMFSRDAKETHVLYPQKGATEMNRLDIQIRATGDVLAKSDTFDVTCQLDLTVGEGNNVYSLPDPTNITFQIGLRESQLGQPGKAFADKIKSEEEFLNGPSMKFLRTLRQVRSTLAGVCNIMGALSGLTVTGGTLETVGKVLETTVYGTAAAPAVTNAGGAIFGPVKEIVGVLWGDKKDVGGGKKEFDGGPVRTICGYITCQNNKNAEALDFTGSAAESLGVTGNTGSSNLGQFAVGELTRNSAPNPKNSIIMSMITQCYGGIIYNLGKWQDINCGYLQCLKDQSVNAGSVEICELGKKHKICTQVVGELFELPFANVITSLMRNLDRIIQNLPGVLAKFLIVNVACESALKETPASNLWTAFCHLANAVVNVMDYADETKQRFADEPLGGDGESTICLTALCNAQDQSQCPRSYSAVDSLTKYTSYLNIGNWVKAQQKTNTQKAAVGAKSPVSQQPIIKTLNTQALLPGYKGAGADYEFKVTSGIATNSYYINNHLVGGDLTKQLDNYFSEHPGMKELYNDPENFKALRDASSFNVPINNPAQLDAFKEQAATLGPTFQTQLLKAKAIESYETCMAAGPACTDAERTTRETALAQQSIYPTDLVLMSAPVVNQQLVADLNSALKDCADCEKAPGVVTSMTYGDNGITYTRDKDGRWTQSSSSTGGYTFAGKLADATTTNGITSLGKPLDGGNCGDPAQGEICTYAGTPYTWDGRSWVAPEVTRELTAGSPELALLYDHSSDCFGTVMNECTINGKIYTFTDDTGWTTRDRPPVTPEVGQNIAKLGTSNIPAGDCKNPGAGATCSFSNKDYVYGADKKWHEAGYLTEEEASSAAETAKAQKFYESFDFFANIAAQWAQSQGYLNWMSLTGSGEWGRGLSDFSRAYISPEGWKNNLCNDLVYDIQDNDEGAIFAASDGGFSKVVGTFGAEVLPIENESGKSYVYILSIYIYNPTRVLKPGEQLSEAFDFKMSAAFKEPGQCTHDCPTGDMALTNGQFKLTQGTSFGSAGSPQTAVRYSNARYNKICITFDKKFPEGAFGKTQYCRTIKENTYNQGSPVVPTPSTTSGSTGGTGGTGGTSGSSGSGDGSLIG